MKKTKYSYNTSFNIELEYCNECKSYVNKNHHIHELSGEISKNGRTM